MTIFELYSRLEEIVFIIKRYEETLQPGEDSPKLKTMQEYRDIAVKELERAISDGTVKNLTVEGVLNLIDYSYKQRKRIFTTTYV